MVVAIVLERNPELEFGDKVDLDSLVKEAFNDFQRDRSRFEGMEKQVRKPLRNLSGYTCCMPNYNCCSKSLTVTVGPRMTWRSSTTHRR